MTGSGTVTDPYIIADVTDLQDIESSLAAYYELAQDIDASSAYTWNGNTGFLPISNFTGQLDGKGYTISGLPIARSGSTNQALFGTISGTAVLKNIKLSGVLILSNSNYAASLVAYISGTTCTITNCSATGTVEITGSTTDYVGGLIGYMEGGTVSGCHSACVVTGADDYAGGFVARTAAGTITECHATGAVVLTDNYGGGFVGYNNANISKCYATGAVTVDDYGGGFVGAQNTGTIQDCYARGAVTGDNIGGFIGITWDDPGNVLTDNCYGTGPLTGSTNVGGFVGNGNGGDQITNCFWDTDTSGTVSSGFTAGGTGKTTVLMKTQVTFTDAGWDFTTVWIMNGYPILQASLHTYPSAAITRATGLVHRYDRNAGVYLLEISLGDTTSRLSLPYSGSTQRMTVEKQQEEDAAPVVEEASKKAIDAASAAARKSALAIISKPAPATPRIGTDEYLKWVLGIDKKEEPGYNIKTMADLQAQLAKMAPSSLPKIGTPEYLPTILGIKKAVPPEPKKKPWLK